MGTSTIEKIELKTRDLLETVIGDIPFLEPPINLAKILEHLNLKMSIASFKDPSVAGAFDKEKNMIYLAKSDSYKRQFFTAAHELGHFVLGHKKKFDVFYRVQATTFNGNAKTDDEEKAANYFAASLLMPKELIERFWDKNHDIELLAAYFGVSRTAAFWRLKSLGLI